MVSCAKNLTVEGDNFRCAEPFRSHSMRHLTLHLTFAYFSELARRDEEPRDRGDWQQATLNAGFQWCVDGRTDKLHATYPETSLYSVSSFNNSITYSWDFVLLFREGMVDCLSRWYKTVFLVADVKPRLSCSRLGGWGPRWVRLDLKPKCGLNVLCLY